MTNAQSNHPNRRHNNKIKEEKKYITIDTTKVHRIIREYF
jgi:hypothetical protein